MPHRLFYILEALKRGFEFEELLDLSKLAPIYLQVLANLVEMEKEAEAATNQPSFQLNHQLAYMRSKRAHPII